MKQIKRYVMAMLLLCSIFVLPTKAQSEPVVAFSSTDIENEGVLTLKNTQNVNAMSFNIKLNTSAVLKNVVPKEHVSGNDVKFNYLYDVNKQTLDIYITSKKVIEDGEIATLQFSSEDNTNATITWNEEKAGLKLVNTSHVSKYQNKIQAETINIKGSKQTPDPIPDPTPDPSPNPDPEPEPDTTYPQANISDKQSGIKINAEEGILPKDTSMKVSSITDEKLVASITDKLSELSDTFTAYDISLLYQGEKIQPKGNSMVRVSIPIPKGYHTDKLAIYCTDPENGIETFEIRIKDNMVEFDTNHFSTYVVAQKGVKHTDSDDQNQGGETIVDDQKENENGGSIPSDEPLTPSDSSNNETGTEETTSSQTGDTTQRNLWVAAFAVSAGIVGVLAYKRKLLKKASK